MNPRLRHLFLASLLRRRLATALSLLAIALGVALGFAVQLIHGAALEEFGRGTRLLAGAADLQVVGAREGFDEALYAVLARRPEVAQASPIVEIEARLPGREDSLTIIGIDLFRVARVQPALLPVAEGGGAGAGADGARGDGRLRALQPDLVFLSEAARTQLAQPTRGFSGAAQPPALEGDVLVTQAGLARVPLAVGGSVPGAEGRLGVMDIAAAQQVFGYFGRLTRIDLKLAQGFGIEAAVARLAPLLPPGVVLREPDLAATEVGSLSRAYRVNLTMLAAIALLTGAFLVFSTQWLAVARRRREFALLRALGLARGQLLRGLLAEGAAVGLVGGVLGIALGYALTALALRVAGGDLGAGFFRGLAPQLPFAPGLSLIYLLLGVLAGLAGTWVPARAAARVAPARALRAGEGERSGLPPEGVRPWAALACLVLAAAVCLLPPAYDIPLGGYAAVLLILAAAVLALPALARVALGLLRPRRGVPWRLAHARLHAAPAQAVVAGAGVIASVALATSMAIMVSSFRVSVDDWLARVLPADLYLRASASSGSGYLDPAALAAIAALPGVAAVDSTRMVNLRVSAEEPVFTLLARSLAQGSVGPGTPAGLETAARACQTGLLLAPPVTRPETPGCTRVAAGLPVIYVSEAAAQRHRLAAGDRFALPLGGQLREFVVAGVWRDYVRQHGAAVITLEDYRALSGDLRINDAAVMLAPGAELQRVASDLRTLFGADRIALALPGEIRAISLELFDRTFLITYLMEAVAVMIGLFGIATTFAALTTTRQGEFGMLRHLGLTRAEIGRLIAAEGALSAGLGVLGGLAAGGAIAAVLIEVINWQSFHWSMDLAVPWRALGVFSLTLVALAALVARLAGRHAMQQSAVLAVKADW